MPAASNQAPPQSPNTPLIEARQLKAGYALSSGQIVQAVDGVTFSIFPNEIVGIAGESGCGKSTLIKLLYGLVKDPLVVQEGNVFFYNGGKAVDLTHDRRSAVSLRWRDIAYVPQASMSVLNPVVRIRKQFEELIAKTGSGRAIDLSQYLDRFGLPSKVLSSYPHQLSGGMRQRVVIAMATLFQPALLLADEPTTGLDVVVQRGILQMMRDMQKEFGMTMVVVSHDMGIHYQLTDRLMVLYGGRIVEFGPTEEIFTNPQHPYTRLLIESLPRLGDRTRREGIKGAPPSLVDPPPGCRFHPRCPHAVATCQQEDPEPVPVNDQHFAACPVIAGRAVPLREEA